MKFEFKEDNDLYKCEVKFGYWNEDKLFLHILKSNGLRVALPIINNSIEWRNIERRNLNSDNKFVPLSIQNYINKVLKLQAFI
jgi:hypothetical protein